MFSTHVLILSSTKLSIQLVAFWESRSHALYRFRLHPTGTFVVMEDEIHEDLDAAFAKASEDIAERSIVDLTSMRAGRASAMMSLSIVPNPASTEISIIPITPHNLVQPLRLEIFDAIGQRVVSTSIPADATSRINIDALPSGSYVVQLVSNDGLTARAMCRVMKLEYSDHFLISTAMAL
jgi:hypothetical protein